jgi:hypothetical protein
LIYLQKGLVNVHPETQEFPSPFEGGGNFFLISICFPSPRAGEGRVREDIPNFSHLPFTKGGRGGDFPPRRDSSVSDPSWKIPKNFSINSTSENFLQDSNQKGAKGSKF